MLILLAMLFSFSGCATDVPVDENMTSTGSQETTKDQADAEDVFFSPDSFSDPYSAAKVLNVRTGEVIVACSDPLCNHSSASETCFFNRSKDSTFMYTSVYANRHIVFAAQKESKDGTVMKLYDYSINDNRIEDVYTFDYIHSTIQLYSNSNAVFFSAINQINGGENEIALYKYDLKNQDIALIDSNAKYSLHPTSVAFFDDYYIHSDHYDQDTSRIWYCKRSYDGQKKEYFDALSDGTPFEIFGYQLKSSGLFASTDAPAGVWLEEEGRILPFPTDGPTTLISTYGDNFYFQSRGSEYTQLGTPVSPGAPSEGYAYDNEVYVLNKDGSYKQYSLDLEYHFITRAAYENIIVGTVAYRILEDGRYIQQDPGSIIRIDLSTGDVTLYDMSKRSGFVSRTFTITVTEHDYPL